MDIEKQVCTLEQAIKLKEIGVKYPGRLFAWVQEESPFYDNPEEAEYQLRYCDGYEWTDHPGYAYHKNIVTAFTVAELGVMLGKEALKDHLKDDCDLNEAVYRADDLICLLEHEEYSAEMVNERLSS